MARKIIDLKDRDDVLTSHVQRRSIIESWLKLVGLKKGFILYKMLIRLPALALLFSFCSAHVLL